MNKAFAFNAWVQTDSRPAAEQERGPCHSTIYQETRQWERRVFVPEGMRPVDLIAQYSGDLPLPPFHALQLTVNKEDVECIATAMREPKLRWRTMFHFTVAPYHGADVGHKGEWVLISGHHRLLAFLLAGVGPDEGSPLRLIKAPLAMSWFAWEDVIWSK